MKNHKTTIHHGCVDIHRDQAMVEGFNQTLAERLFGYQYAVEMRDLVSQIRAAANNEVTRLIGKKPAEAIKEKAVDNLFEACWTE